jgi:hypothetical protein
MKTMGKTRHKVRHRVRHYEPSHLYTGRDMLYVGRLRSEGKSREEAEKMLYEKNHPKKKPKKDVKKQSYTTGELFGGSPGNIKSMFE